MGQPELLPAPFTRSFKSKEKADTKYVNTYAEDPDFIAFQELANKPVVAPVKNFGLFIDISLVSFILFRLCVEGGRTDDESCFPRYRFPSQSIGCIGIPDGSGHGKAYAAEPTLTVSSRESPVSSSWRRQGTSRKSDRHSNQSEQCEPDRQVSPSTTVLDEHLNFTITFFLYSDRKEKKKQKRREKEEQRRREKAALLAANPGSNAGDDSASQQARDKLKKKKVSFYEQPHVILLVLLRQDIGKRIIVVCCTH